MTTNTKTPRCQHFTKNGARCHADPQTGKRFCFLHDPEQKKQAALARQLGGEARTRQLEIRPSETLALPILPLQSGSDVLEFVFQTVNHFCDRVIGGHALKTLNYLASLLLRALKQKAPQVTGLLARTINQFRRNEIGLRDAKAIGQAANLMLCALKHIAWEAQTAQNEEAQDQQTQSEQIKDQRAGKKLQDNLKTMLTSILPPKPPQEQAANENRVEPACEPAFA